MSKAFPHVVLHMESKDSYCSECLRTPCTGQQSAWCVLEEGRSHISIGSLLKAQTLGHLTLGSTVREPTG